MNNANLSIRECISYYEVRAMFFHDVFKHINNPEMVAAIKADGVNLDAGMFIDPVDAYCRMNSPASKTRNWLIVQGLHK